MRGIHQHAMVIMYLLLLPVALFTTTDAADTAKKSHYQLRGLMEDGGGNKDTEDMDEEDDDEMTKTNVNTTMVMLNGTSATTTPQQQQALVDLVHLIPFDVQIAVAINMGIQTYEVLNIVTNWFTDAYREQLAIFGYTYDTPYAQFNSIVLFDNNEQQRKHARYTQVNNNNLYTVKVRGGVVFTRDVNHTLSVPEPDVLVIQQNILLDDATLLSLLKQSTDTTGLGEYVIDVNAFFNPTEKTNNQNGNSNNSASNSNNNSGLDVVIIVAIVIAVIAFLFLLGAIIWAYRFDRANRDAYLSSNLKDQNTVTSRPKSYTKGPNDNNNHSGNNNNNSNDKTTSETETVNDPDTPERIHRSTIVIEGSPNSVNNTSIPNIYPTMIGIGGGSNGNSGKEKNQPIFTMSDNNEIGDNNDDDGNYPDSVVSGSGISEDISTSLSQYYRSGMGKADLYGRASGMLSDAGSVSSMESYGYSLDGGMSMAIPTEIPFNPQQLQQRDRTRIGGLPIEPDGIVTSNSQDGGVFDERSMDDVQILDLDKELSNLNIKLLPKYGTDNDDTDDDKNGTYPDLEKYQLGDIKGISQLNDNGIPTVVSTTSSTASRTSSKKTSSSRASSSKKSITAPIDTDSMMGTPDSDDEDEFIEESLPKLTTDKII